MNVVFLSKSLDETAGGLLPVMQHLCQHLSGLDVAVSPLGVDLSENGNISSGWNGKIYTFSCRGPKSVGISPEMISALNKLDPDIVDLEAPSRMVY